MPLNESTKQAIASTVKSAVGLMAIASAQQFLKNVEVGGQKVVLFTARK